MCDELCQKRRKLKICVSCTFGKALILTTLLIEDKRDVAYSINKIYEMEEMGRLGLDREFIRITRDR